MFLVLLELNMEEKQEFKRLIELAARQGDSSDSVSEFDKSFLNKLKEGVADAESNPG